MDNNRILLVLAAKPGGDSALYVNGIESRLDSKEMRRILELSQLAGKYRSPWCGIIDNSFFIKGSFDNKDDNGNEMTFSYAVNKGLGDGKKDFFDYIKALGYRVNSETLHYLETQTVINKPLIMGITAFIIIALIIVLLKVVK